jgi:hypothetical protein
MTAVIRLPRKLGATARLSLVERTPSTVAPTSSTARLRSRLPRPPRMSVPS